MSNHPTDYGPEPSVASLQAQIFRLEGEIERLRRALQRIKDNGERGGYAYGVAFVALEHKP